MSCYSVLPVGNTDLLQQTTGNSEFNSEGVHAVPEWATQCTQKNCAHFGIFLNTAEIFMISC